MAETTVAPTNKTVVFQGRAQRERPRTGGFGMPWSPKTFASRHNHSASPAEAQAGAEQANAILKNTGNEGMALAVANKRIAKLRKRGLISPKAHAKMASKYGSTSDTSDSIDAASR
jgi:hypothetical protein